MRMTPGHMMAEEEYTLTTEQIDALNALPPGVYFVCFQCRRFSPAPTALNFVAPDYIVCDRCF